VIVQRFETGIAVMQQYCNTAQQMSNLRLANNEHQELRCSLRSSLKGEPNGREGVRKTAMESLPEGGHGFPGGSAIKPSEDGEAIHDRGNGLDR